MSLFSIAQAYSSCDNDKLPEEGNINYDFDKSAEKINSEKLIELSAKLSITEDVKKSLEFSPLANRLRPRRRSHPIKNDLNKPKNKLVKRKPHCKVSKCESVQSAAKEETEQQFGPVDKSTMEKQLSASLPFLHCKIVFNFINDDENVVNSNDNNIQQQGWIYSKDGYTFNDHISSKEMQNFDKMKQFPYYLNSCEPEYETDFESTDSEQELFNPVTICKTQLPHSLGNRVTHEKENESQLVTDQTQQQKLKMKSVKHSRNMLGLQDGKPLKQTSKIWECPICFKQLKGNMDRHMQMHSGVKPYKCSFCSATFRYSWNCKAHECTHTGKYPLKCSICLKGFYKPSYLRNHMLIHTRERPFKCTFCPKSFQRKYHLKRHVVTHSDKIPYQCIFCLKRFNQKLGLSDHIRRHTGEKPFNCSYCSKSFNRNNNRNRHQNNYHHRRRQVTAQ